MGDVAGIPSTRRLLILHFNDVYQVEPGGDAERFTTQASFTFTPATT